MKLNDKGFVSLVILIVSVVILAFLLLWVVENYTKSQQNIQNQQDQTQGIQNEENQGQTKSPIEQAEDLKKQNDELQEKREEEYNSIYNSP